MNIDFDSILIYKYYWWDTTQIEDSNAMKSPTHTHTSILFENGLQAARADSDITWTLMSPVSFYEQTWANYSTRLHGTEQANDLTVSLNKLNNGSFFTLY